jgi:hypothetical protein
LAITHTTFAQGTAFTYHGRLNNGANPANGTKSITVNPPTGNLFFRLKQ